MPRFDHPLRLDNTLFVLAIIIAAAFAVDRFLIQEHEKTAIAQARELRDSAVARASDACAPNDAPTRQSDAHDPCVKPAVRRK